MTRQGPANPDRTYTEAEKHQLTRQLGHVLHDVHHGGYSGRRFDAALLCELHRRIFEGVRSFAGHLRSRDYGEERLTFSPNRSTHRDEVPERVEAVFTQLRTSLRSFDDNPDDPDYEHKATHVAAWAHAEVILIHPFRDGNGRTGRALMGAILVRLGLHPVAVEGTKQEYRRVLNHYFQTKDLQPLVDLLIDLYAANLDDRE